MLRAVVFATCLLYVASAARLLSSASITSSGKGEFDYFMFVRQWPGSFCARRSCPLYHKHGFTFTIHGLWPNYNDGTWPQFCDSQYAFEEEEIDDIQDALETEWPSFMGSDEDFWEHEWSKHGTCALNVLPSEHKFFKTVLKLHWRYDLADALRAANIVPSKDAVYHKKDVVQAIYDKYGARPLVHCNGREMSEIWMCFDKQLRPFSCSTDMERPGCEELIIPPMPSDSSLIATKSTSLLKNAAATSSLLSAAKRGAAAVVDVASE